MTNFPSITSHVLSHGLKCEKSWAGVVAINTWPAATAIPRPPEQVAPLSLLNCQVLLEKRKFDSSVWPNQSANVPLAASVLTKERPPSGWGNKSEKGVDIVHVRHLHIFPVTIE